MTMSETVHGYFETTAVKCGACGEEVNFRIYDGHCRFQESFGTKFRHRLRTTGGDVWFVHCELLKFDDVNRLTRSELGMDRWK